MYKIMLTVRNRLAITKKCIEALEKHSELPYQLYVYDNLTNYRTKEHYLYFYEKYEEGKITQLTFNTKDSTFNAFSKAISCNQFGFNHSQDPNIDKFKFLVFLDNDIIVTKDWDLYLSEAWNEVQKRNLNNVKIIGQLPGGIKHLQDLNFTVKGCNVKIGKLGGSGLWSVRPNFFNEIGFLNPRGLVNHDKRHDSSYWNVIDRVTRGKPYIMGLAHKLGIHCGNISGSVCNVLTRNSHMKNKDELVKFEKQEKNIDSISFDDFYSKITNDKELLKDW